ncbi:MAG: Fe-S protein assembly co-chaperone HscB [Nannocystaceae bacterium]|nr:Fe-S protein assembly co-chaperone HscB [Nannocystaceae bacterium]
MDHFERLGQPRQHALDRETLESAYLARAATAHPDKVDQDDASAKRVAMETSAAINEAYRTLRDPGKRAEYLVKLGGRDLDSSDPDVGAPKMPQAFLIEMIEHRERVADARSAGADALDELRDEIDGQQAAALEGAVAAIASGDTDAASRHLVVRRYLQRLLDEIDEEG